MSYIAKPNFMFKIEEGYIILSSHKLYAMNSILNETKWSSDFCKSIHMAMVTFVLYIYLCIWLINVPIFRGILRWPWEIRIFLLMK